MCKIVKNMIQWRKIVENNEKKKELSKMAALLEKSFTSQNTIPASELRKISQKKLKEKVEENAVMGIIIKDEMALAMMEMKEFENLIDYVEELEQMLEEAKLVNKYLKEMLETPEEEFIEMPTNMSVKEYKKWRKEMNI